MTCPECGGPLRVVLINNIEAEIQETGAEIGNRVRQTYYRCDKCGGEFEEDWDDEQIGNNRQ